MRLTLNGTERHVPDVWRDEAVLQLNINNEKVLTRQLEATRDRFDVGELTRTDVAQSESRLSRATAERIGAEGDLTASEAVYQEVIGQPPDLVGLEPPAKLPSLPGTQNEVVRGAIENNPTKRNPPVMTLQHMIVSFPNHFCPRFISPNGSIRSSRQSYPHRGVLAKRKFGYSFRKSVQSFRRELVRGLSAGFGFGGG